jgi:hypothetical protein
LGQNKELTSQFYYPKEAVVRFPLAAAFLFLLSSFEQVECSAKWTACGMALYAKASLGLPGSTVVGSSETQLSIQSAILCAQAGVPVKLNLALFHRNEKALPYFGGNDRAGTPTIPCRLRSKARVAGTLMPLQSACQVAGSLALHRISFCIAWLRFSVRQDSFLS